MTHRRRPDGLSGTAVPQAVAESVSISLNEAANDGQRDSVSTE